MFIFYVAVFINHTDHLETSIFIYGNKSDKRTLSDQNCWDFTANYLMCYRLMR